MTLVEMLVVLAILAVVYALALPSLQNPATSVALRLTALDMKSRLGMARAVAIARSRPVAFRFDLPARRYASEADGRWVVLPADLSMTVSTAREISEKARAARLVFFPDGSSTGGRVSLRRADQSYEVAVDWLTGQASIEAVP